MSAKLAVSNTGVVAGAVSGGCVEGSVVQVADRMLRGGAPALLHLSLDDEEAWSVGLPCGGGIDIYVAGPPHFAFADIAPADGRAALVTVLRGPGHGAQRLVRADRASEGSLGDPSLDADADELMWIERSELREHRKRSAVMRRLRGSTTYGRQQTPRAIRHSTTDKSTPPKQTSRGPCAVTSMNRALSPGAERVISAGPQDAFAELGGLDRATAVAVLTRTPQAHQRSQTRGCRLTRVTAVVLAAGAGRRFERERPKHLALLEGRSLLAHAAAHALDDVVLVLGAPRRSWPRSPPVARAWSSPRTGKKGWPPRCAPTSLRPATRTGW